MVFRPGSVCNGAGGDRLGGPRAAPPRLSLLGDSRPGRRDRGLRRCEGPGPAWRPAGRRGRILARASNVGRNGQQGHREPRRSGERRACGLRADGRTGSSRPAHSGGTAATRGRATANGGPAMTRNRAILVAAGSIALLAVVAVWRDISRDLYGPVHRELPPGSVVNPSEGLPASRDTERQQPRATRRNSARDRSQPSLEAESVDELRAVLASTSKRDAAARMDALAILQDRDEREGFDRALEHLRDRDGGVRAVAAELLGDSGDNYAVSGLHKALEHERVPQIREAIAAALVKLDPDYDDRGAAGARGEAVRRDRVVHEALGEYGAGLDQAGVGRQARDATPPADTEPGSD